MNAREKPCCFRTLLPWLCAGVIALTFAGCAGPPRRAVPPAFADSVTFLRVELECPVARGIACGSEAKPFLQRLDKRAEIKQSWLNRSGTIMAIEWEPETSASSRAPALAAVTFNRRRPLEVKVLNARERASVDESFRSRTGWYQAADMDTITAEEARTIASRLVWRMTLAADLPAEKRETLLSTMAGMLAERLTATGDDPARRGLRGVSVQILKVAERILTEAELEALDQALRGGFGPGPYDP